jgi:hypothetical protein
VNEEEPNKIRVRVERHGDEKEIKQGGREWIGWDDCESCGGRLSS